MKRSLITISFMACLVCTVVCPSAWGSQARERGDLMTVAQSINAFGLDVYSRLDKGVTNLFLSPYSLSVALAMVTAGAQGDTKLQMEEVLHLGPWRKGLHDALADLNATILSSCRGGGVTLDIANGVWAQQGFGFRNEFVERLRTSYGTTPRLVDFRKSPGLASAEINRWVDEKTRGRIKKFMNPDSLSKLTKLILASAVYFKGKWHDPFEKNLTHKADFFPARGKVVPVQLMQRKGRYKYLEERDFQVIEIPYKGGEMAMVIFLPGVQSSLDEFEKSLTLNRISQCILGMRNRKVSVYLPKFEVIYSASLESALKSMGMTAAFSSRDADFRAMAPEKGLFLGKVLQKTFVEVAEYGTEAAAVTRVDVVGSAAPGAHPHPIPEFRADRPFLFMVRHSSSGCILFIGRFSTP